MELNICHLYPDILNLYGDRGNIITMKRRLESRGISVNVDECSIGQPLDVDKYDIFFIGGGQDFEQEVLLRDLASGKGKDICTAVEEEKVFLAICGGYQMLGQTLDDPTGSESGRPQTLRGLGLLPTRTVFSEQKRRAQVKATVAAAPFAGAELEGYEIHTGVTEAEGEPFAHYPDGGREGCVQGNVFGTYLHGLFDTGTLTEALAGWLCRRKGIDPSTRPSSRWKSTAASSSTSWPTVCAGRWIWTRCMPRWEWRSAEWNRDFCICTGATARERLPPPWGWRCGRWAMAAGWSSCNF